MIVRGQICTAIGASRPRNATRLAYSPVCNRRRIALASEAVANRVRCFRSLAGLQPGRGGTMGAEAARRLRVAVVGTGFGAAVQIPGLQRYSRTEVVAVAARSDAHARETAARFGIPHAFTSVDAMLELDGVDAVSIASPPATHHALTLAALRAGKHVLCEKPFALN